MNHDDFVIAEYNQLYELVRHYADAQRQFFQMFLTAFGAVCAGYFALETNPALNHLSNKLLVLGFVGNLFFLALIVSNRAYFQINFRKVEYFRQRFLYTNPDEWRDYPLFNVANNAKRGQGDGYKSMRWRSAYFLRVMIVCAASAILFYLMRFPESCGIVAEWKYLLTFIIFVLLLLLSSLYTNWRERSIVGKYAPKQD
jgi:hypothetical protein